TTTIQVFQNLDGLTQKTFQVLKNLEGQKMESKVRKLFIVLGAFFVTNALMAEFIGVKLFSLEATLGLPALHFHFFGFDIPGFNMTAGVLLCPFVFVLTD